MVVVVVVRTGAAPAPLVGRADPKTTTRTIPNTRSRGDLCFKAAGCTDAPVRATRARRPRLSCLGTQENQRTRTTAQETTVMS